jgi:hypothetical protein
MARCAVADNRYSAQAVWNYCNCGAQRAADMATSPEKEGLVREKLKPWVVACKAAHLR